MRTQWCRCGGHSTFLSLFVEYHIYIFCMSCVFCNGVSSPDALIRAQMPLSVSIFVKKTRSALN